MTLWDRFTSDVGILVAIDLALVFIVDLIAYFTGLQTVSGSIRNSWLAWPVGILAGIVIGVIILNHFVNQSLPGK